MKLVIPFDYENKELSEIIDNIIHDERDRNILKHRFIDKRKYERLGEDFDISSSQVRRIIDKGLQEILKYYKKHNHF